MKTESENRKLSRQRARYEEILGHVRLGRNLSEEQVAEAMHLANCLNRSWIEDRLAARPPLAPTPVRGVDGANADHPVYPHLMVSKPSQF